MSRTEGRQSRGSGKTHRVWFIMIYHMFVYKARDSIVHCIRYVINDSNNNNNNRRLVTLAEHTSDHGRQTNSSTEEKGEQV